MTEDLRAFHARVDGFTKDSLPHDGWLRTSSGLRDKVDENGNFLPFFGNTILYELDERTKLALAKRQVLLHHVCGYCMARPIGSETFHITLHDLASDSDLERAEQKIKDTEERAKTLLKERKSNMRPLRMVATQMFSMVNTSVVMGFAPEGEEECGYLMELYEVFHAVVPLAYGLTPHVTLGYYKPGEYGQDTIERLEWVFREAARMEAIHLVLQPDALLYRMFTDMNHYRG